MNTSTVFYGFRSKTKDGLWIEPEGVKITNMDEFQNFILESILDCYEIRIVSEDKDDTNYHVIERNLLFPRPEGYQNVPNRWDPIIGKFVPEGVVREETEGEKFARKHGLFH